MAYDNGFGGIFLKIEILFLTHTIHHFIIQWFLVESQSCLIITAVSFQNLPRSLKLNLKPPSETCSVFSVGFCPGNVMSTEAHSVCVCVLCLPTRLHHPFSVCVCVVSAHSASPSLLSVLLQHELPFCDVPLYVQDSFCGSLYRLMDMGFVSCFWVTLKMTEHLVCQKFLVLFSSPR